MMDKTQIKRRAGLVSIISGALGIISIIAIVLMYATLIPQLSNGGTQESSNTVAIFGFTNDFLTLLTALFLLIFMILFHLIQANMAYRISVIITLVGCIGAFWIVMVMAGFIFKTISLMEQGALFTLAFGPLGLWHLRASYVGRINKVVSVSLSRLGIILGIGELVAFISFFAFGGLEIFSMTDFQALLSNYPLMIGASLGGIISYVAGPIWSVGVGRFLLSH